MSLKWGLEGRFVIWAENRGHSSSSEVNMGRTASDIKYTGWCEDSPGNSACALQESACSQPFSFKLHVWVPALVWLSQPSFIPWIIWPLLSGVVATHMTSDCLSEGGTITVVTGVLRTRAGDFQVHTYPSTVQKSHCFMPENVRLESGNFALMPLLFLLMKISLDNYINWDRKLPIGGPWIPFIHSSNSWVPPPVWEFCSPRKASQ